ncbi:YagU family protein [Xenorhabdus entomophaga]|uniref:YagU family protein n=1 Tax=Xenorhabdus entomophaga TaxID=3136257 RepID=UPI0030F4564F
MPSFLSLSVTKRNTRHYGIALWAGFLGGNIASFAKWGTEILMPPRTPNRAIPPGEMLQSWGGKVNDMVYHYSDHLVNWGMAGVHHLFSIILAMFYSVIAEIFPIVKLWHGAFFAVIVAFIFHGIILPIYGWSPVFWELPFDEIFSEIVGTIIWMWAIEIFRHDIRTRMVKD